MFARLTLCLALLSTAAHADDYAVGQTFDNPMQIAYNEMAAFSYDGEGRPMIDVEVSSDFSGQVTLLIAETGFADDSVAGERNHYVLTQQDGVWTLIYTEQSFMCWRGLNTVTWQSGYCP